jgi:5-methylcytosine-specific restriction endonuclease McrA
MTTTALLLNANYQPIKVIPWVRAIGLILEEKADLVEGYIGRVLHSPSTEMAWPAVVRLRTFVRVQARIRFNRKNVLARDAYRCGYCGDRPRDGKGPDIEALTIDHVVPRAQSKHGRVLTRGGVSIPVTCWENVITSCHKCNLRKADRTPEQAGMKALWNPKKPSPMDVLRMNITKHHIPEEWKLYLPADNAWRNYWDVELDEG